MVNCAKNIYIRVRANELEEGRCYFTQINAYDIDDPKKDCLFKIPITVVKPHRFSDLVKAKAEDYTKTFKTVQFKQGQIHRHFFRPPHGATHAELSVKYESCGPVKDHTPLFVVQAFTLGHFRSSQDSAKEDSYRMSTKNEFKSVFKVGHHFC